MRKFIKTISVSGSSWFSRSLAFLSVSLNKELFWIPFKEVIVYSGTWMARLPLKMAIFNHWTCYIFSSSKISTKTFCNIERFIPVDRYTNILISMMHLFGYGLCYLTWPMASINEKEVGALPSLTSGMYSVSVGIILLHKTNYLPGWLYSVYWNVI